MKKQLTLFLILLILTLGACSNNNLIVEPIKNPNFSVSQIGSEPNWLLNTPLINPVLSKIHVMKQFIFKDKDSEIKMDKKYVDVEGNTIKVKVKMKIGRGTLAKDCEIEMQIDDETGVMTFLPHQEFNKVVILDVELSGLEPDFINPEDVSFVYLAQNGEYEEVDYKKLEFKIKEGRLSIKLKKAELSHISRYGFCKLKKPRHKK